MMAETSAVPVLTTEIKLCADDCAVVVCHGRLVAGTEDGFYATVRALMPANKRIVLDLADLQHTDSRGLGALVRLYVAGKSAGSDVELTHLSKQIRYLLGITDLTKVFTVIGESGVKFM
jgi:anti-sigma B factor antagonist